ncbi:MAG: phosphomannose isomerase type II C-terminal cupin domain [Nostocoides sp.]
MSQIDDPRTDMFVAHRPWGAFEQFIMNRPVTVKIITVNPGHRLSLQSHTARGEFWRVLTGPVDVTVDERTWSAEPGEDVWIPVGSTHRLGNSGTAPATILELALGAFDENDIVRYEDDYAR